MKISYARHADIDKGKWDHCIENAANGLLYACSFYLDAICKHWDALILGDYEAVMPLTWNKKYGFYYLYQPFFTGPLGIFGNISDELVNLFLDAVPQHFKYMDIDFKENIITPHKITLQYLHLTKRNNFFLDLNRKYAEINKNYKRLAARMLKKAVGNNIEIVKDSDPGEVIRFYQKNYEAEHKNITSGDYERLFAATSIAFKKGKAMTYLAKKNAEIVAVYMILKDRKFIYSLIGGSNKMGKDCGAFYLLTDSAIKDHAESNRIFRFEGSDKEGIAFFNTQFNPVPVHYYHLRLNRLPWLVRLLKK